MRSSLPPARSPHLSSQRAPSRSLQSFLLAGLRCVQFWMVACMLFVVVVLVAVALEMTPLSDQAVIGKLGRLLSMLFAAICCSWMSRRAAPGRERWAWSCITLAVVGYVIAEAIILFFLITNGSALSPGVTAALSTPFYLLGATGVLILPAVQTTSIKLVYMLLDVCIIVGAVLGLAFVFVLAPRLADGLPVDYGVIVIPIVDVTAALAFIVLLARGVQQHYGPALLLLIITAVCFSYGDAAVSYLALPNLHGSSPGLPFYDSVWIAGAFAVALAPLSLLIPCSISGRVWGWLGQLAGRLSLPDRLRWVGQLLVLMMPAGVLFGLTIYSASKPLVGATLPLAILGLVVVVLILTRQVLTARDLVDARIATERAEQLDSLKDQFITSVNHELRTPLMTMKGYLALLTNPQIEAPQEKRREMLTRANRSCENLVYLVQSILDTRRIDQEAGNFTPEALNVQAAMQAALTLIDPREADPASRQIVIDTPNNLTIWGEAVRVQQILTNLISNAIKYSPAGTPIMVRAYSLPERAFRLMGGKSGGLPMVEITVQDQGLGIPPEQKALLFRRFVRLPRDIASMVRGTGLGLYLCRVFAEAMGGSIWVESTGVPGEGSTFHLRLPAPPASIALEPALTMTGANPHAVV